MGVQLLISQKGPLPINAVFDAIGDNPMYLEVNGSVWTPTANKMIGIQIALNGVVVGTANIFSNAPATHRAVVPAYIKVKLKQGPHAITLSVTPGTTTVSDFNDFYTAVIHY